jgi:peptidoglycan/xylan/chitin deacetylase (PgdA/CDA1 family)
MKRLALEVMNKSGMFGLARVASAKLARILTYHNFCDDSETIPGSIGIGALRCQLKYLRESFHVIPLSRLVSQIKAGQPLGSHTVVLTVDDGRRNCYRYLFPLLREFRMPAAFFVVSSFVEGRSWIWTDKVLWLSRHQKARRLLHDRLNAIFEHLMRVPPDARDAQIEALALATGIQIPETPPAPFDPCTLGELREMADSGLLEIGSHTVSHPILSTLSEGESWLELTESRAALERGLQGPVTSFCFPNGKSGDYLPVHVEQIKAAGYACAVLTRPCMVNEKSDPYQLPRIGICDQIDPLIFSKYLNGVEYYQTRLEGKLGLRAQAHAAAR